MRPIFAAAVLAAAVPSVAQASVMSACRSEAERVCVGGGETQVVHCLSVNWAELSPSCRDAMRGWNASRALATSSVRHPTHIIPVKRVPKPSGLPKPPPGLPEPPSGLPEELRAPGAVAASGRKAAAAAGRGAVTARPADARGGDRL